MGWVRMDDARADHPKLLAAGLAARGLDEACIEWCSRHETDGVIPANAVAGLALAHGTPQWKPIAKRLVDVGRWSTKPGGYAIHDYLDYNPSAEEQKMRREQTKERVNRHRKGRSNGVTGALVTRAVTQGVTVLPGNTAPDPTRPDVLQQSAAANVSPGVAAAAAAPSELADQALAILADRRPRGERNPAGYRRSVIAGLRNDHSDELARLDWAQPWTPQMLANWLEPATVTPPAALHPQADRTQIGCDQCDHGLVEVDTNTYRRCPNCHPAETHGPPVVDLMAALETSLTRAQGNR